MDCEAPACEKDEGLEFAGGCVLGRGVSFLGLVSRKAKRTVDILRGLWPLFLASLNQVGLASQAWLCRLPWLVAAGRRCGKSTGSLF